MRPYSIGQALMCNDLNWTGYGNDGVHKSFEGDDTAVGTHRRQLDGYDVKKAIWGR